MMVQPKTPPLSIRPGDVRLAKIDAYATKHGLKRHAAVLELIDVGLDGIVAVATRRPTPKPKPGSDAAARKADAALASQAKIVERLNKAEKVTATKVSVPFAGDVVRRPTPKKDK